jgi:hypothetical protein
MAEPMAHRSMDLGPTKYDDVGYHAGPAEEAGQPREYAFTHIGLYLAWLIRHDLHDPRGFPPEHIEAVKRGEMTGSDLADDIDWKLLSDSMTSEGAAFSDARYGAYLGELAALFSDEPDYGVPDDAASYARVEPLIDRLYAEWVTAGRPLREPNEPSSLEQEFEGMLGGADIPWDELIADGPIGLQLHPDGSYSIERPEVPHADPDLEALVPFDLVGPSIEMSSDTGSAWSSSLLDRALKGLGVRPRDVTVANGLAGDGEGVFGITLYRVPGASAAALESAFAAAIFRPRGSEWLVRRVGDADVRWAEGYADPGRTVYVNAAYWTRDGLVLHVHGRPEDMDTAIRRLG